MARCGSWPENPLAMGGTLPITFRVAARIWWRATFWVLEPGSVLQDHLQWLKVTGLAWYSDGFFYSRYDAPQDGHDLSSRNEGHRVYYHRLGTPQSDDHLIYEDKAHPQRFHTVQTTEDERFAILTVSERGQGKDGNALFFSDLSKFVP